MPHTFYLVIQLYTTNSLFVPLISVTYRECSSRVVDIGYQTNNLKTENNSAIHYFLALVSVRYIRYIPVGGNDVMENGMRHHKKLKKFV